MKKAFLILLLLAGGAQAQFFSQHNSFSHLVKTHTRNRAVIQKDTLAAGGKGVAADTLWEIRGMTSGNGADTSRAYETAPFQTIWMRFTSAADDSVNFKIVRFTAPETEYKAGSLPPYSQFVRTDSFTVSRADGLQEQPKYWFVTGSTVPIVRWEYYRCIGLSENKKAGAGITGRIERSCWSQIPRP